MCDFVSWIELDGKGEEPRIRFLTTDLIPKALELGIDPRDLTGHEAIRRVFGMERDEGVEREYTDFTSPSNFPPEIVQAILRGSMRGLGMVPTGLLHKSLIKEYRATRRPLDDEYWAKRTLLDDEYRATRRPPDEEHRARCSLLHKEYWARRSLLDEEYWTKFADPANRTEAWQKVN